MDWKEYGAMLLKAASNPYTDAYEKGHSSFKENLEKETFAFKKMVEEMLFGDDGKSGIRGIITQSANQEDETYELAVDSQRGLEQVLDSIMDLEKEIKRADVRFMEAMKSYVELLGSMGL